MPALDGLRALAISAVVLYHADIEALPGGFLGVEVFFVISGYLITALLFAEWQWNGRIVLTNFWLRRARRLLPALYTLLFVVLGFAVLALPDDAVPGAVVGPETPRTADDTYFDTADLRLARWEEPT